MIDARSPLTLAALATKAIPGLEVVQLLAPQRVTADTACTGLLDRLGREWTIVYPLNDSAGASLFGQVAALRSLSVEYDTGAIPFDVPRPVGTARLDGGRQALIYRSLPGSELVEDDLIFSEKQAASLGIALAALHMLPQSVIARTGLPIYDAATCRKQKRAALQEALASKNIPDVLAQRWQHFLDDDALWRFQPVPVHGDLSCETILVEDQEVVVIKDFGKLHVGDPATDLHWPLAICAENNVDVLWEAYLEERGGCDRGLRERAEFLSEMAVVDWLLHGLHTADKEIIDDAKDMLAELVEMFSADERDVPETDKKETLTEPAPLTDIVQPVRIVDLGNVRRPRPETNAHITGRSTQE